MVDYDYLGWGVGLSPEDKMKAADYTELEQRHLFQTDKGSMMYDEELQEDEEFGLWYIEPLKSDLWEDGIEARKERRQNIEAQIAEFVKEVKPGHEVWEWRGGTFLDAFLLEDVEGISETEYDSVLLLAPDPKKAYPLAVIWEMVPEEKRAMLLNLQKAGKKIYAAFSDIFQFPDEKFLCLEIYIK